MENIKINRKKITDKFQESDVLNALNKMYSNDYDLSKAQYINSDTSIQLICKVHPDILIKKRFPALKVSGYIPCEVCRKGVENSAIMNDLLFKAFPNNEYKLMSPVYVKTDRSELHCQQHDLIFKGPSLKKLSDSVDNVLNKRLPCPKCAEEFKANKVAQVDKKVIKNIDKYAEAVSNLNCKILKSSNGDADIQCNECNKVHSVRIESYVLNGYGCPYCNINKILQESNSNKMRNYRDKASAKFVFSENFKFKVRNKYNNDDSFIIGEYQGMSEKIECNCTTHGNYSAMPNDIISSKVINKMCPGCSASKPRTFDEIQGGVIND